MSITINDQTYYRTREVCSMLGVSRNTLYRWLNKGILGDVELRDSRGWRLFTHDETRKLGAAINRINKIDRYANSKI